MHHHDHNHVHSHNHDHNHDHDHDHKHNHKAHGHDSKSTGTNLCIADNREIEINPKLDRSIIARHVWKSCKPGSRFMVKSATVSVRRVQLMRAQLQFSSREWENEPPSEHNSEEEFNQSKKGGAAKNGCQCAKKTQSNSHSMSSSEGIHACPDECQGGECEEEEREGEEDCDYQ